MVEDGRWVCTQHLMVLGYFPSCLTDNEHPLYVIEGCSEFEKAPYNGDCNSSMPYG